MPHATASAASSTVHMGERVHLDRTMSVLLVGVGGQGTILAGNILAMTASEAGLDVKVSEIHGMSQRGGSVSTIIRMGEHVDSMVCDPGCADVVVAFEELEALRAQQYLREALGLSVIVNPMIEIVASLLLGAAMGGVLTLLEKLFFSNKNRLSLTIAFVVMTIALSGLEFDLGGGVKLAFSSLLVCMMLGTMFCNLSEYSVDIMARSEQWTAPLYAVFFVLSGAQLDLTVFRYPSVLLIGLVYILVRCAGKYLGARVSSTAMGCDDKVKKYLGITLFPQAGVALGMVVTAQTLGAEMGAMIRNIILFSVLVYELIGPLLTKEALMAAGEVQAKPSDQQHRARFQKKAAA